MKHYSKRYKAKLKQQTREIYLKQVKDRIKENANNLGLSIKKYCENETIEHDIW